LRYYTRIGDYPEAIEGTKAIEDWLRTLTFLFGDRLLREIESWYRDPND
jgi:hypothetical protein